MKTYPLHEVAKNAEAIMSQGADVYQQFNCAKCGTKQTMSVKNNFFTKGECEECGHVTDLRIAGCNFMAHFHGK